METAEQIINKIKIFYAETGNIPKNKDFKNSSSIKRIFGSWNNALESAGFMPRPKYIKKFCLTCGIDISKQQFKIKFCSRSCAATLNNKLHPKRKKEFKYKCQTKSCNTIIQKRSSLCKACFISSYSTSDKKFKDLLSPNSKRSAVHNKIRMSARNRYREEVKKGCEVCGYSKIVDVAHIKPLSAFSLEDFIEEANKRENIAILCKKCHFKFDRGFMDEQALRFLISFNPYKINLNSYYVTAQSF